MQSSSVVEAYTQAGEGSYDVEVKEVLGARSGGSGGGRGDQPVEPSPVKTEDFWALACVGNGPEEGQQDVGCTRAFSCPQGSPFVLYWHWRRTVDLRTGQASPWRNVGEACLGAAPAPAAATPDIAELVRREWQRLPLPGATARIQPPDGRTLVNLDTIFYTDAGTVDFPLTLLGRQVVVRATPALFTWHFGDGQSLGPTPLRGALYPSKEVTHRYHQAGVIVRPYVAVTYRGEFSIDGGALTPITGTVTVDGPPVDLQVVEARSELIANGHGS